MNNICVNLDNNTVSVESGQTWPIAPEHMEGLLREVLDVLCYGGEAVCVEVKKDGRYTGGSERWSGWRIA